MSFVTAIRDYVELVNNLYDSAAGNLTIQTFCYETFLYLLATIGHLCYYLITFQWLRDVSYLPILVPQFSTAVFHEVFWLEEPLANLFTISEWPTYADNRFLIGFFNSFFLCLPISCSHLIVGRRLLVQGVYAGLASGFGTLFGFLAIVGSVVFGFRPFVVPWFSFEPAPYLLGLVLVFSYVFRITHYSNRKIVQPFQKDILLRIFLFNFALAWCEQTSVYHYLTDFSFGPEPTLFDLDKTEGHSVYLLGLLVGGVFFMGVVGFLLQKVEQLLVTYLFQRISSFKTAVDTTVQITLLILAFTSFPFYGLDFLLAGPLGFVSQDRGLEKTPFSPYGQRLVQSKEGKPLLQIDTDIVPFGRGDYLQADFPEVGIKSFEDLNYGAEYAWNSKEDHDQSGVEKKFPIQKPLRQFFSKIIKGTSDFGLKRSSTEVSLGKETSKGEPVPEKGVSGKLVLSDSETFKPNDLLDIHNVNSLQKGKKLKERYPERVKTGFSVARDRSSSSQESISSKGDGLNPTQTAERTDDAMEEEALESNLSSQDLQKNWKEFYSRADGTHDKLKGYVDENLLPLFDNSFSVDMEEEQSDKRSLEKKAKFAAIYYSNPVYKLLLASDIDTFVARQPTSRMLSSTQEKELFQKRAILTAYYDTLRQYSQLPYYEQFQDRFAGSKSYADRVYNQQFKGTLRVVRRLFAVTLDPAERGDNASQAEQLVAKFDQPLYREIRLTNDIKKGARLDQPEEITAGLFHEELEQSNQSVLKGGSMATPATRGNHENKLLTVQISSDQKSHSNDQKDLHTTAPSTAQNLAPDIHKVNKDIQEVDKTLCDTSSSFEMYGMNGKERGSYSRSEYQVEELNPFFESVNPKPFYAGWDERLRKLIVTNRLRPRLLSGYTLTNPNPIAPFTGQNPGIDQTDEEFLEPEPDIHGPLETRGKNKKQTNPNQSLDAQNKVATYSYGGLEGSLFSPIAPKSIEFTAWPVPEKDLKSPEIRAKKDHTLLFQAVDDPSLKKEIKPFFVPVQDVLGAPLSLSSDEKKDLTKTLSQPDGILKLPNELNRLGLKLGQTRFQVSFVEPVDQENEVEEDETEAQKENEKEFLTFEPELFNLYLYKNIPVNVVKQLGVNKISPPSRGGFVWPGEYKFKLDLKKAWK